MREPPTILYRKTGTKYWQDARYLWYKDDRGTPPTRHAVLKQLTTGQMARSAWEILEIKLISYTEILLEPRIETEHIEE